MRTVIEINEAVNGWRLDIFNSNVGPNTYHENFERYQDVLLYLTRWIQSENQKIKAKLEVL